MSPVVLDVKDYPILGQIVETCRGGENVIITHHGIEQMRLSSSGCDADGVLRILVTIAEPQIIPGDSPLR